MEEKNIKNIRKLGRTGITVLIAVVVCSMVATGALLSYFGQINASANVLQAITIDGHAWNDPIVHEFTVGAGCCKCYGHTVVNNGCEDVWLEFEHWATPDMVGISILVVLPEGECCECYEELCGELVDMTPFFLEAESSVLICVCYNFDTMLKPGVYQIHSKLVLAEA